MVTFTEEILNEKLHFCAVKYTAIYTQLTRWYVPIQIGHAIDISERQQFNFVPRAILKNLPSSYSEKMRWGRGCRQSGHA